MIQNKKLMAKETGDIAAADVYETDKIAQNILPLLRMHTCNVCAKFEYTVSDGRTIYIIQMCICNN